MKRKVLAAVTPSIIDLVHHVAEAPVTRMTLP
jgi:hypothetical protein